MDCGLAPRCPNRFLSLDGKLLMDAIYDGDDWVDHYTWRLVGSNDNGDVVFDGLCPKHLHPFNMSRTLSRGKIGPGPNDMGSGPLPISTRPRRPRRVLPTLVFAV